MSDAAPTPKTPESEREKHRLGAEGAVIRADDLVAGYLPGVTTLSGAGLYRQPGELVGIIGPNGAGTATLLRALCGLVRIHSGTVALNDEVIPNQRADILVS